MGRIFLEDRCAKPADSIHRPPDPARGLLYFQPKRVLDTESEKADKTKDCYDKLGRARALPLYIPCIYSFDMRPCLRRGTCPGDEGSHIRFFSKKFCFLVS